MSEEIAELYEQLFGKELVEPTSEQDVRDILSCIRTSHGQIYQADEDELQKSSPMLRTKVKLIASAARKLWLDLPPRSQLYDDSFRFFFEVIQNADDAIFEPWVIPTIQFRVFPSEIIAEVNEKGYLSKCAFNLSYRSKFQN
ncbi:hypothetical protein LTS08_001410 [Lithohypha guttulata]|nr:hypothetical protein LTS08_001410 [Lithohypha guttulata]